MAENLIRPKEATAILNSLVSGVVPRSGIQHVTVGRSDEINAILDALNDVKNGHSMVKFWIGDFGSGKSFMLHLLNVLALKQKFVVSNVDFTPENRLYSNDNKATALYTAIIDNISIQTKPEGDALSLLLEKWIDGIVTQVAIDNDTLFSDVRSEKYLPVIQSRISQKINEITEIGAFDFGLVIMKYYEGYIKGDDKLRRDALKWLKGEYRTKTEARNDLGVREIVNDNNYYNMLKNFTRLFVNMGYSGFIINLDEAINLYKISTSTMREKNYEKILSIYNDCYQGKVENLFFNFAGTSEFLESERRGLYSYQALKTRLEPNKYETSEFRDYSQPVLKLLPLNHNEIFVLLKKIKDIFDNHYNLKSDITDDNIKDFMEDLFNKPGADEFLTPREVIRDFLNILNLLRYNPELSKDQLLNSFSNKEDNLPTILVNDIEEL